MTKENYSEIIEFTKKNAFHKQLNFIIHKQLNII